MKKNTIRTALLPSRNFARTMTTQGWLQRGDSHACRPDTKQRAKTRRNLLPDDSTDRTYMLHTARRQSTQTQLPQRKHPSIADNGTQVFRSAAGPQLPDSHKPVVGGDWPRNQPIRVETPGQTPKRLNPRKNPLKTHPKIQPQTWSNFSCLSH